MSDIEAGLGGTQVAAALGKAVPTPRTHHPYVVGLVFTTIGLFAVVGSITGTLPSMLAALFVPQALEDVNGKHPAPEGVLGQITGVLAATNPINYPSDLLNRFGLHLPTVP
jgi:hypothetical protein